MTDIETMLEPLNNAEQAELATVLRICAQLVIGRQVTFNLPEFQLIHLEGEQIPAFQARVRSHLIRRPLADGMNSDTLCRIMNYLTEERPISMLVFVAGEVTFISADRHGLSEASKSATVRDLANYEERSERNHMHQIRQGLVSK